MDIEIAELNIYKTEFLRIKPSTMVHANEIPIFPLFIKAINGGCFLQHFFRSDCSCQIILKFINFLALKTKSVTVFFVVQQTLRIIRFSGSGEVEFV